MRDLEQMLSAHPFFTGLDPAHIGVIAGCGTNRTFAPGEFLFREGAPANEFHIVREGQVAIELHAVPKGAMTVQTLGPGEVTGWSWIVPPYRWRFDARARTQVRTTALDGACLRGKCEADASLGYAMLKRFTQVMAQRLEAVRLQLIDIHG